MSDPHFDLGHEGGMLAKATAIVTGGGRGIGKAIALAFARAGGRVAIAARTQAQLEAVRTEIRAFGGEAVSVPADVSRAADVTRVVMTARRAFGPIDILVNNAGIQGPIGPLVELDVTAWVQTLQVNLIGAFLCCKEVLPEMIERRTGVIINLSGGGATTPRPNFSAYSASKAAVVRFTETLAEEVKSYNIRVNAIAPGAVATQMQREILAAGSAAGAKELAEAQRTLETGGFPPEKVGELAVFLASRASHGLTGKLISCPHDPWEAWDAKKIRDLAKTSWLTLRRLDEYTLNSLSDPSGE